jgi:RNA polymerase sigma-70 factor (ECF subfamily)
MLGSVEDAEDAVQETLLRAWRARGGFEGRSLFRSWLYRIASNVCLNMLQRQPRRFLPPDVAAPNRDPLARPAWTPDVAWLQPYPDHLLETMAAPDSEPDAVVLARETIELAYLAAIQHLPPRQRAVLILRDALGLPADETADLLETTVASVKSSLQRARATMRRVLPPRPLEWTSATEPNAQEHAVLQRYMRAQRDSDVTELRALLREDARQTMPPAAFWLDGRAAIVAHKASCKAQPPLGDVRTVALSANRQPAVAFYIRGAGERQYKLMSVDLLRIHEGKIAEISSFLDPLIRAIGLPTTL